MDEYRFEVYHYGKKIKEFKSNSLMEIGRISNPYLQSDNVGVKLFINDKEIPYLEIKKVLKARINHNIINC